MIAPLVTKELTRERLAALGGPKTVTVPFKLYPAETFGLEEIQEIASALRTARPVGGLGLIRDKVQDFEDAYAKWCGAKYAVSTNSGTSTVHCGLVAAGVGPGDEVIVPGYTYQGSVTPILQCMGIPVFADVDPDRYTIDTDDVEKKITPRTKVILPVHWNGQPADMKRLREIADDHGLKIVVDNAQASGALYRGTNTANDPNADIVSTSLQASKNLSCWSEGGIVTTNDEELYERIALVGQHVYRLQNMIKNEKLKKYADIGYGYNYRMTVLSAALGLVALRKVDAANDLRIRNCTFLTDQLKGLTGITPPFKAPEVKHVYWMFGFKYNEKQLGVPRQKFIDAVNAEGVAQSGGKASEGEVTFSGGLFIHVPSPLYSRSIFQELNYFGKGYPFKCSEAVPPKYGPLPICEQFCYHEMIDLYDVIQPPNGLDLMKEVAQAIVKVVGNIDQLRNN